jgi:hypothetical protein
MERLVGIRCPPTVGYLTVVERRACNQYSQNVGRRAFRSSCGQVYYLTTRLLRDARATLGSWLRDADAKALAVIQDAT